MDASDRARALEAEEASRREPGMGSAMLAILVMLITTAVLSIAIYGVMIAISPIEARTKGAAAEQPIHLIQQTSTSRAA